MNKLYLVWNEAKTECAGFDSEEGANYAVNGGSHWDEETMIFTRLGDEWIAIHCDEECTITEIEV